MYSWDKIRAVCVILLLLPLAHLLVLVAGETLSLLDKSPETWRDEIEAYAELDARAVLPEDPVVVVGGRRAWLWQGLEEELEPHPVIMRGLTGATLDDVLYHYERLVGFYQAEVLVVVPGISEFHLRDNKSVLEFVEAVKELEKLDRSMRGADEFFLFAPIKTVLFPSDNERIENINLQLRRWAEDYERVTVLDANPLLADSIGRPDPAYFRPDGANLNEQGYLQLSTLLREELHNHPPLDRDQPGLPRIDQPQG